MYKVNLFGYSQLYNSNKDLKIEDMLKVITQLDGLLYDAYGNVHNLNEGLFTRCEKHRKEINALEGNIMRKLMQVSHVECYIECCEEQAKEYNKTIYQYLDEFIDDNSLYIEAIIVAQKFGSKIDSIEKKGRELVQKEKKDRAEEFKKIIEEKNMNMNVK